MSEWVLGKRPYEKCMEGLQSDTTLKKVQDVRLKIIKVPYMTHTVFLCFAYTYIVLFFRLCNYVL
jgi:hypothetical protein